MLSIIPLYLMLILGATKIRKNFGWLTAGIFALCIVCMPQLMNFYTQLRMYSWALFFVTASFVYIWEIINNESSYKNWGVLILLTICSVYTHYFSGIASFILYLFLFVYLIKNNKKDLKNGFLQQLYLYWHLCHGVLFYLAKWLVYTPDIGLLL